MQFIIKDAVKYVFYISKAPYFQMYLLSWKYPFKTWMIETNNIWFENIINGEDTQNQNP